MLKIVTQFFVKLNKTNIINLQVKLFKIKRILDEHNIQYSLFGIDRTNYYCFDDVSMTHMRLIQ